jgi:DNA-binding transcriptional ArsR family regulator
MRALVSVLWGCGLGVGRVALRGVDWHDGSMSDDVSAPPTTISEPVNPPPKVAGALEVLKAVAVPMRYAVLRVLADGSYPPVVDLAKKVGCNTDLMGRHLKLMQKAGLVVRVRDSDGRSKYYQIPSQFRSLTPEGGRVLDFGSVVLRLDAAGTPSA